jgi:hypothetical protein
MSGNADELRAMALHAMREHAAVEPRGFDSQRKRADLHRQIDDLLDDWVLEAAVEAVS